MTATQQRIALAEIDCPEKKWVVTALNSVVYKDGYFFEPAPDYLNDLNALFSLLKKMEGDGWVWRIETSKSIYIIRLFKFDEVINWGHINLTSAISEAILRAHGKWVE